MLQQGWWHDRSIMSQFLAERVWESKIWRFWTPFGEEAIKAKNPRPAQASDFLPGNTCND